MTEQLITNQNVAYGPIVRMVRANDEDLEITFSELLETTGADHDPALISDTELGELVAEHLDISYNQLKEVVYGNATDRKLVVERRETGSVIIRPETVLG